jgi:hypothetical protein
VLGFSRARLRARTALAALPPRLDAALAERIQQLIARHPCEKPTGLESGSCLGGTHFPLTAPAFGGRTTGHMGYTFSPLWEEVEMPWKECSVMDERLQFVGRRLAGEPMAELCREFGISRKTGTRSSSATRSSATDRTLPRNMLPPTRGHRYSESQALRSQSEHDKLGVMNHPGEVDR